MQKYVGSDDTEFLCHYGVKGMKWRVKGTSKSGKTIEEDSLVETTAKNLRKQIKEAKQKKKYLKNIKRLPKNAPRDETEERKRHQKVNKKPRHSNYGWIEHGLK